MHARAGLVGRVVIAVATISASLAAATASTEAAVAIGFGRSALVGETSDFPTSLQFGPDGRLYVSQFDGLIKVYDVVRNGPNSYSVASAETITAIRSIPNHNDDGSPNTTENSRLVTGLLVSGTAANPVIFATSSDPRIGGGSGGSDVNLDTNSGTISRLSWDGSSWVKLDLVRGLPRSEHNHTANGMALDSSTNTLFVAQGGNTNKGAPSNNFALLPEFALSAGILSVDLDAIGATTYDLPTLDDATRTGDPDPNDPFGGNDGRNQAKIVSGGPVQVYAPGFRNPYDVLIAGSGNMYTIDNGANSGWGNVPVGEGPGGGCTNGINEAGTSAPDHLHLIGGAGYYGGHPNPTRGNTANTFNATAPQSPVPSSDPRQCDSLSTADNGSLATFPGSTNGIAEYTAPNFGGAMAGDLIAAGYSVKAILRVVLDGTGSDVVSSNTLFSSVGTHPLDVTTQGADGPFPGTIWVADTGGTIHVFEPNDYEGTDPGCTRSDSASLDEDADGFDNADELDNGTDPCSAGDLPPDWDDDKTSNRNDPDDDNDGLSDTSDPFAIDDTNGLSTAIPVSYTWEGGAPDPGGLLGLGFTGLMTNKKANYEALFDPTNVVAGGAAGVTTVERVPAGDALKAKNTQMYGFQFGVSPPSSGKFTVHTRVLAPFAGMTPQNSQSMGLMVGKGDQDNYVKLVTTMSNGTGIKFLKEVTAATKSARKQSVTLPGPDHVDLYMTIDVDRKTVLPSYSVTTGGLTGARINLGSAVTIPSTWLSAGFAVGLISTSTGPGPEFAATWDFIEVVSG